jgi:hypothetical protein
MLGHARSIQIAGLHWGLGIGLGLGWGQDVVSSLEPQPWPWLMTEDAFVALLAPLLKHFESLWMDRGAS